MNDADWNTLIQRYQDGSATQEEALALQQALMADAGLRALYLDYSNLDVALGAAASLNPSQRSSIPVLKLNDAGTGNTTNLTRPADWRSTHGWRWLVATAACAALIVLALLPGHRNARPPQPDIAATISSTQNAIAALSVEPSPSLPGWMSPTASLLDQPVFSY